MACRVHNKPKFQIKNDQSWQLNLEADMNRSNQLAASIMGGVLKVNLHLLNLRFGLLTYFHEVRVVDSFSRIVNGYREE